ncbi:MAG TPA: hypothetical protein VF331_17310, partial [Polyangiales bacterium]
ETQSVPEWDAHLRFAYHDDDFLGGMRKLRLEDRPRLILLRDFPQVPRPAAQSTRRRAHKISSGNSMGTTVYAAYAHAPHLRS